MAGSLMGAYWSALINYLNTESVAIADSNLSGDITWDNYSDVHSPQQNPIGWVYLPLNRTSPVSSLETAIEHNLEFRIRLIVSYPNTESEPQLKLADTGEWLLKSLYKLRRDGLTGTFRGKVIKNAFLGCDIDPMQLFFEKLKTEDSQGKIFTTLKMAVEHQLL